MSETSTSLLDRLRRSPDEEAWRQLTELYTPLIRGWLRRYALLDQDADDVVQDVLAGVVRRLPEFRLHRQVARAGATPPDRARADRLRVAPCRSWRRGGNSFLSFPLWPPRK